MYNEHYIIPVSDHLQALTVLFHYFIIEEISRIQSCPMQKIIKASFLHLFIFSYLFVQFLCCFD